MPSPASAHGGSTFNGGTITAPLLIEPSNKDDSALQLRPVSGATADATNQLEVYSDASVSLGFWDAAGQLGTAFPGGTTSELFVTATEMYFAVQDAITTSRLNQVEASTDGVYIGVATNRALHLRPGSLATTADTFRVDASGAIVTAAHAAPADAALVAGECALWFDQTNGAAKLMVKAKQANGTVVTGSLALA